MRTLGKYIVVHSRPSDQSCISFLRLHIDWTDLSKGTSKSDLLSSKAKQGGWSTQLCPTGIIDRAFQSTRRPARSMCHEEEEADTRVCDGRVTSVDL